MVLATQNSATQAAFECPAQCLHARDSASILQGAQGAAPLLAASRPPADLIG